MSRSSFGLPTINDMNLQGRVVRNTTWEHQAIVQYEVEDVCTYKGSWYQCIMQSDESKNAARIPTNATYWKSLSGSGSVSTESIVAWLKNSGSKVFNYVGGELSSFTITATDDSIWTQALNFTEGNLTSITYTHDSGNESVWENTVITKTFNYTNGELSSIDYNRS